MQLPVRMHTYTRGLDVLPLLKKDMYPAVDDNDDDNVIQSVRRDNRNTCRLSERVDAVYTIRGVLAVLQVIGGRANPVLASADAYAQRVRERRGPQGARVQTRRDTCDARTRAARARTVCARTSNIYDI